MFFRGVYYKSQNYMEVGIDIVNIEEFKTKMGDGDALLSVFLDSELKSFTGFESLAGVFAAKEAFFKALGRKIDWKDVWVKKSDTGKPQLQTNATDYNIKLSISHSKDYAVAVVLIEK